MLPGSNQLRYASVPLCTLYHSTKCPFLMRRQIGNDDADCRVCLRVAVLDVLPDGCIMKTNRRCAAGASYRGGESGQFPGAGLDDFPADRCSLVWPLYAMSSAAPSSKLPVFAIVFSAALSAHSRLDRRFQARSPSAQPYTYP